MIPLSGTTKRKGILFSFRNHFERKNNNINEIFCATTDGAPAMVGKEKGFVKLPENHIGHKILNFHCIIYQESLVRKLVGTAVSVGLGKLSLSDVKQMFENPNPEKWQKSLLPSPGGLYLAQLHYDKEDFLMNDVPMLSPEKEEIAENSQIQHA
ncbi:tRNA pseudouridine synthase [Trichonephila inaurata madagascariensis]|uniref:tRNA pseudouridine synthase n=1 Tax=Trichonephila inaurata madagascariensis TaxID=2747483 RepID=A0A8X6XCV0_9ARAC|nr:tRNA pseudouridine synthase [Trichonephila inaurata madagascariensis]